MQVQQRKSSLYRLAFVYYKVKIICFNKYRNSI